jgi:hypothetical protein
VVHGPDGEGTGEHRSRRGTAGRTRSVAAISAFVRRRELTSPAYARTADQHEGRPYRVLYALDPRRAAILLLGGDKTGKDRWYEDHVPKADDLYDEYLRELKKEGLI